jgi:hypothetical protein
MVPRETVTVVIRSSVGDDAPLTVNDAMRQILDFFELLSAAGGDEGSFIDWQLVEVAMRSPLSATAEAISKEPGVPAEPIARREKVTLASSIEDMVLRSAVPTWMNEHARETAKALFARNMNGIGRTDIQFERDAPLTIIDQRQARVAISAIERFEKELLSLQEDLTRIEMGSVEGNVLWTGSYRGNPAIQVRERMTGADVWCVFVTELAEKIGPRYSWATTWTNRHVLVTGQIIYSRDGNIRNVYASYIEDIDARPITYKDIADPNFTGGLGASKYIESLWEEDVG